MTTLNRKIPPRPQSNRDEPYQFSVDGARIFFLPGEVEVGIALLADRFVESLRAHEAVLVIKY